MKKVVRRYTKKQENILYLVVLIMGLITGRALLDGRLLYSLLLGAFASCVGYMIYKGRK